MLNRFKVLALSSALLLSSINHKAHAHSGAGTIILLPFYVTFWVLDYAWISMKILPKGFTVRTFNVSSDSINKLIVTHRKSGLVYSFYRANTIESAVNACSRIEGMRVASPEEVGELYRIRSIDRIGSLITNEESKNMVFGYSDTDSAPYFSYNVETKEKEFYDRPHEVKEDSPVICVIKKEDLSDDDYI